MLDNYDYTHTHNMQYLLLFHGNSGFANSLLCYVCTYINCPVAIFGGNTSGDSKMMELMCIYSSCNKQKDTNNWQVDFGCYGLNHAVLLKAISD
jgi:hypothetical protein